MKQPVRQECSSAGTCAFDKGCDINDCEPASADLTAASRLAEADSTNHAAELLDMPASDDSQPPAMSASASAQQQSHREVSAATLMLRTQVVPTIPVWPTSSAAEWSEIQVTAARVLVLLECLWSSCSDDQTSEHGELVEATLIVILHQLTVGHILDWQLTLGQLCFYGVLLILLGSCHIYKWSAFTTRPLAVQQLTDLRAAFLRRITEYSKALKPDVPVEGGCCRDAQTATAVWMLLCKHAAAHDMNALFFSKYYLLACF